MSNLALWENPWCLFALLLLIALLLMGGALVSLSRQREAARRQRPHRTTRLSARPAAAPGPIEGLSAIGERLADLERQLPADTADSRWLAGLRNDLRNVEDDLRWYVLNASDAERSPLLERLGDAVALLDHAITGGLAAQLRQEDDRSAIYAQLERLRRAVEE